MSRKYIFIKFFSKIVSTQKFIGSELKHCECNTTSIFQYKKSIMTHHEQKSGSNPLDQILIFFNENLKKT